MPKFTSIYDQSKVRYADRVILQNFENEKDLPKLQDTNTLGREWRYYKKDIEKARRVWKKQNEREANRSQSQRRDGRDQRSGYGGSSRGSGGPPRHGIGSGGLPHKRNRPWGE